MTNEFLVDTENLFRGYRLQPSVNQDRAIRDRLNKESRAVYSDMYGPFQPFDHAVRLFHTMEAVSYWFRAEVGVRLELVRSYGKRTDHGVRVFDTAMLLDQEIFRYAGMGKNYDQTVGVDFVRVLHFTVGYEKDAAEKELIAKATASLGKDPSGTYALASSDSGEAIAPMNDLQRRYPAITVWVVLRPTDLGQRRKFGAGCQFMAIPQERVVRLPEIAQRYRRYLRNQKTAERRKRKAKDESLARIARAEEQTTVENSIAPAPARVNDPDTVSIDEAFETITNMDWNALLRTPVQAWEEWGKALGASWAEHSVKRWLKPVCMSVVMEQQIVDGTMHRDNLRQMVGRAFLMSMRNDPERRWDVEFAVRNDANEPSSPLRILFDSLVTVLINEDLIREDEKLR